MDVDTARTQCSARRLAQGIPAAAANDVLLAAHERATGSAPGTALSVHRAPDHHRVSITAGRGAGAGGRISCDAIAEDSTAG